MDLIHTKSSTEIIIEERSGIPRNNEPVTFGVPFPKALLRDVKSFRLSATDQKLLPIQAKPLALWPDGSLKWVLLDFQTSVKENEKNYFLLQWDRTDFPHPPIDNPIKIKQKGHCLEINTGAACFVLNTIEFKPFDRVVVNGTELLKSRGGETLLTLEDGLHLKPIITYYTIETTGPIRATIKFEGEFSTLENTKFANFFARISFFNNSAISKIEITLWNPKAANHPGGLWDLGDPGSIFFQDFSIKLFSNLGSNPAVSLKAERKLPPLFSEGQEVLIYQDSSGGENWRSSNHVNRQGKVKTSFRGYHIYRDGQMIYEGFRAEPHISIFNDTHSVSAAVQHFWENFPKALESNQRHIIIRLFPNQFADIFELQGGERKTHKLFLDFHGNGLEWINVPLVPRTKLKWYADSNAIPYLSPENDNQDDKLNSLIQSAIKGQNHFFDRREIIDEYGWRNFGEFYADHEAVGHKGPIPLISHYNNQYDCIHATLCQYLCTADIKWYVLANQLCEHVKDIDIYHTDQDRSEYNGGLFWHTEHHLDAHTATHRCYSKRHLELRDAKLYGGGPALSHIYTSGLLLHYYLTGSPSSYDALEILFKFGEKNLASEKTICNHLIRHTKDIVFFFKDLLIRKKLVDTNKIYSLNGPGRASGNLLNTFIDAFRATGSKKYLWKSDILIRSCVHPLDDIKKRDLLDTENRWMYTIFLHSLSKFLDVKAEYNEIDSIYLYARQCLVNYAKWMTDNEYPYLSQPEKLEYPNETWAAQELRKANLFILAENYTYGSLQNTLYQKANHFHKEAISYLLQFKDSSQLTRPLILAMIYGRLFTFNKIHIEKPSIHCPPDDLYCGNMSSTGFIFTKFCKIKDNLLLTHLLLKSSSYQTELEWITSRLKSKFTALKRRFEITPKPGHIGLTNS